MNDFYKDWSKQEEQKDGFIRGLMNKEKRAKEKSITLEIDFDGVIRDTQTGKPVEGALKAMKWLDSKGRKMVISTAREDLDNVQKWLNKYGFDRWELTNKKIRATAIIDDRAIRFLNWKDVTSYF